AAHGAAVSGSLDELLADPRVAVVYVALPHHLLGPTAERALAAGKHALVEKPLALDPAAVAALQRLAAEQGRTIAPVFELRPRGVVRDGWRARRAEAGGGVVLMNSIHQLDLIRYLTGLSFVRAVAEVATAYADVEVEDTAAAVLRLSNGAIVGLAAAAHSPGAS